MGKLKDQITPKQHTFIEEQHMFFVATSPMEETGMINLSPKGLDCFRILSPNKVGYLDLTGSGNETAAHIAQNGRVTFMFCAFQGAPNILRLYGRGRVVLPGSQEWSTLFPLFVPLPGARQIIVADIAKTQDSCGFAVPFMAYEGERDQLTTWATKMGPDKLSAYQLEKNTTSLDGLKAPRPNEN